MKPKRTPVSQPQIGLLAWLEGTRIALPLKGVECRFDVTGTVASVELDQIYHQDAQCALDCTYTFPLPAGAAVHRCELHINGRVIRARVEAKDDARRIYREQKAAGRRVALVETERENLFTLSLGNVQPGDLVVVRFAWFQVLDRTGDGLRLRVPCCPGVRYIPGQPLLRASTGQGTVDDTDEVPDASRLTPPRMDALHPDAAYFCIEGRLSASDVASGTASSPSHAIHIREKEPNVTVELSGRAAVPDRDFVLAWQEPKAATLVPRAWHWSEGGAAYALVQLRAPDEVPVAQDYSQDFYFLVDRSGSMKGAKWECTCEALRAFVELLGADDRVWITLFETDFRDFAEAPLAAPRVLADAGFRKMAALGTGGDTELLPAATHVLEQIGRHSAERQTTVILITDGQVGNEATVQAAFRAARTVTVHTFGIDTAVNDAFLRALARQQRGGCWLQTPDDDIAGTIAALGDRLRRPVFSKLAVAAPWEPGGDFPCADLHAGDVAVIALRSASALPAISITGQLPDGHERQVTIDAGATGHEAIKLLWARERMTALLEAGRPREAIATAREHNLICEGAAFIAWDEAEQVQIAEEIIVQPAMAADMAVNYSHRVMQGHMPKPYDKVWSFDCALPSPEREVVAPRLTEVRSLLEKWASSKEWLERIMGSIKGDTTEGGKAAHHLLRAGVLLKEVNDLVSDASGRTKFPRLHEATRREIASALSGSLEDLLRWEETTGPHNSSAQIMGRCLRSVEVPIEIVDHLLTWMWASAACDGESMAKLLRLVEALLNVPFSVHSKVRLWEDFLAAASGLDPDVRPLVVKWLGATEKEMADA